MIQNPNSQSDTLLRGVEIVIALLLLTLFIYLIFEVIRFANLTIRPIPCIGNVDDCNLALETLEKLPQEGSTLRSITFRYDYPSLGGYTATNGEMWIAGDMPPQYKRTLLVHEYGHAVDFFILKGKVDRKSTPFTVRNMPVFANDPSLEFYVISWTNATTKKKTAFPQDFVSAYAQESVIEDFAESFAYFVLAPEAFEERASMNAALRMKLEYMKKLFPKNFHAATGREWKGNIPSATTYLMYEWGE